MNKGYRKADFSSIRSEQMRVGRFGFTIVLFYNFINPGNDSDSLCGQKLQIK